MATTGKNKKKKDNKTITAGTMTPTKGEAGLSLMSQHFHGLPGIYHSRKRFETVEAIFVIVIRPQTDCSTQSPQKPTKPKPYLPPEIRTMVYQTYNLSNKYFLRHPKQTFYQGSQLDAQASVAVGLSQSYVSGIASNMNTGDTEGSTLAPYDLGLKYEEYRYVSIRSGRLVGRAELYHV